MDTRPVQMGDRVRLVSLFHRHCVDCKAWLPLRQWFGGRQYCRQCELRRLAQLIAAAEARNRLEEFRLP